MTRPRSARPTALRSGGIRHRPVAIRTGVVLTALALAAPGALAQPGAAAAAEAGPALLARYAPAIVNVEAVLRTEISMGGQGQNQEGKAEMVGALVDPSGLVMIWNSRISSGRIKEMLEVMGQSGSGDFGLKITPLSFEVTIAGRGERLRAFLAASDERLDVAFLQLDEPPAEPLPAIDLSAAVTPRLGEPVYTVSRLNQSFDRAAYFESGELVGEVSKPRRGWIPGGDLSAMGLPVFDATGRPVGVLATVLSTVSQEDSGATPFNGGMFGQSGKTLGPLGGFVLPAEPVARAVALSKERAAVLREQRRESGESAEPVPEETAPEGESKGDPAPEAAPEPDEAASEPEQALGEPEQAPSEPAPSASGPEDAPPAEPPGG